MKILSWFDIYFQGFSRQDFHQRDRKEKQDYKIPPSTGDFKVYILLDREEDTPTEWHLPEFLTILYFSLCKYLETLDKTKPALCQKQDCP